MDRIWQAALIVVGVPTVLVGYVALVEWGLKLVSDKQRPRIRPWLWIAPAILFLLVYLVYPSLYTFYLSLFDANSSNYVGLANYVYVFTNSQTLIALRNNLLWLVFFTSLTVSLGLLFAVLTDRVRYEAVAKAIIFLPMAISFVAAGVIWKLMYDYRPPLAPQTGTVNALLMLIPGAQPHAWLIEQPINNFALIFVGIWMWVGFCMVILSAGLKGIPAEILDAARVDGANEWQVLTRVIVPMLSSTIAVVATTMIIFALKAFDIVYVMTSGNFNTDVIANRMYTEMFTNQNFGRASADAIILLAAIVPIMVININRFRVQEQQR